MKRKNNISTQTIKIEMKEYKSSCIVYVIMLYSYGFLRRIESRRQIQQKESSLTHAKQIIPDPSLENF